MKRMTLVTGNYSAPSAREEEDVRHTGIRSNPFKWRIRKVAVLLAAVTAIGGGVVTAPSANAADGYVYVYEHYNFAGNSCRWYGNAADYRNTGCGNWNDRVSSIWNNGYSGSYDDVWFYEHINYQGARFCVPNGAQLKYVGHWWNDRISSHYWGGCP